ncbi:MAG: hypothetical protein HY751_07045 [Nitrospinae bacterium]|nr:hypothetical protein [Nitrospinota bacterium]
MMIERNLALWFVLAALAIPFPALGLEEDPEFKEARKIFLQARDHKEGALEKADNLCATKPGISICC